MALNWRHGVAFVAGMMLQLLLGWFGVTGLFGLPWP